MTSTDDALARELVALVHRLQEAVQQHDVAVLEELVAPGFRLITSRSGNPFRRDEWLASAAGPFEVASFSLRDFVVTADQDTAVVSHRQTQDATLAGRKAHDEWLISDTWVRRAGRWQMLLRHAEPVHARPVRVEEGTHAVAGAASVVRRYADDIVGTWRLEEADAVLADRVVAHEPSGDFEGIESWRRSMARWAESFPERRISTEDLFEQDDRVCWRWRLEGRHASGRPVSLHGSIVFKVRDGRIVEYWGVYDRLALQEQLA